MWYFENKDFDLIVYTYTDFAGCKIDWENTSGSSQFLGRRLVSCYSKKHHSVSTSTTEVEFSCWKLLCSNLGDE